MRVEPTNTNAQIPKASLSGSFHFKPLSKLRIPNEDIPFKRIMESQVVFDDRFNANASLLLSSNI